MKDQSQARFFNGRNADCAMICAFPAIAAMNIWGLTPYCSKSREVNSMDQNSRDNLDSVFSAGVSQKPVQDPLQGVRLLPVLALLMAILAGICLMLGHYEIWMDFVY
jgi:hypothetical protein